MTITIGVTIPKSWPRKRQADARTGALRPTGRPDFDNTSKLLCDALNGIVWGNDAQITDVLFSKFYSERPETVLVVRQVRP